MSPKYLSDIIPRSTWIRTLRNANNIPLVRVNNNYFTNTFFPSDLSIRNSTSRNIFKGRLLQSVTPLEISVYTYCVYVVCVYQNPIGIKCVTRQRLGFIHLRYHKFKHGFLDVIDPLCNCSTAIENTVYYFLHCPNFSTAQNTFLNEIAIAGRLIIDLDKVKIIQTFLYGDLTYSANKSKLILDASINYILETKRFDGVKKGG